MNFISLTLLGWDSIEPMAADKPKGATAVADEDEKAVAKADKTAQEETEDEAAKVFKLERKPAPKKDPKDTTSSSIVTVTIHSDDALFNRTLIVLGQNLEQAGRPEQAMELHAMMLKV